MSTGLEDLCMGVEVIRSQMVLIYQSFLNPAMSVHKQNYTECMSAEISLIG